MHDVPCEWLRRARRDLRLAELALGEGFHEESAFHSQQAAEKALKALLIALGRRPPKTHSIGWLLSIVEESGISTAEINRSRILTDYAVEARYPTFEEVTGDEAEEALSLARTVVEWARRRLRDLGVEC